MNLLPIEDQHALRSALGWLELGNAQEALTELDSISGESLDHWDVLMVRWCILAELKDWEKALETARKQLQKAPEKVDGWIHQAYALRRTPGGGLVKAQEALLQAASLFPDQELVAYNLACYAAQLGAENEAWDWLTTAIKICGNAQIIKKRALADDDLKPLWARISDLSTGA